MEIASFMEVRAASACTNACNLQTEERANELADWQQAGRCAAGLKRIRQELWQAALIPLLGKITPDSILFHC